jgi:hypothetical protein
MVCISIYLTIYSGCKSNNNSKNQLDTTLDYAYIQKKIKIDSNEYSRIIYDSELLFYDSLYVLNPLINEAYWYNSFDSNAICFLDNDTLKCLFSFVLHQYAVKIFPPQYEINRRLISCNTAINDNSNSLIYSKINSILYLNEKNINVGDTVKLTLLLTENNEKKKINRQNFCCQSLIVKTSDTLLNTVFNILYAVKF